MAPPVLGADREHRLVVLAPGAFELRGKRETTEVFGVDVQSENWR